MSAMALFGEKYGHIVRVVDVNGWSTEFCGGTHVKNIAQIGCVKIVGENSVAAGIRRIEAVSGAGVLQLLNERTEILVKAANALKANSIKDVAEHAESVMVQLKEVNKELTQAKDTLASQKIDGLLEHADDVDGIKIVTAYLSGITPDALRTLCEKSRDRFNDMVVAVVGSVDDKITLAISCGSTVVARGVKAGNLVKSVAAIAGGKGGGKPDFAMAGLKEPSKIDDALHSVKDFVKESMK